MYVGTTRGSLLDWGIGYQEIELKYELDESTKINRAVFDLQKIDEILSANKKIKVLHIQRSVSLYDQLYVCMYEKMFKSMHEHKMVGFSSFIRSCGYQWRPSILVEEIRRLCTHIRKTHVCMYVCLYVMSL
jgi:cystathionine beta-lyase family protein involved in aluminum resistance